MATLRYKKVKKFGEASLDVITKANRICLDYQQQGYDLTLRQLYYQFVSRDWIRNSDREYKRLGSIINEARMAGLLDWDFITDRIRNLKSLAHWDSPSDAMIAIAQQYRTSKWDNQPEHVEVWVEKDALVGVLDVVCRRNDVPYFSCRGYNSQSEMWGASQRLLPYLLEGKRVTVLHLGDHDPSGIDMTRDIRERMVNFFMWDLVRHFGRNGAEIRNSDINDVLDLFTVDRIALTMDQITEYDPPPNPAKMSDSRAEEYVEAYGDESWELDALDPATLDALIQEHIDLHKDEFNWETDIAAEEEERLKLEAISDHWAEVAEFLAGLTLEGS